MQQHYGRQQEFDSDEDYDDEQYDEDMMGEYGEEYEDQLDSSEEAMQIRMMNEERIRQAKAKAAVAP